MLTSLGCESSGDFSFQEDEMESFSSEIIQDLASAMLKVQADISPAIKDGENPFAKI